MSLVDSTIATGNSTTPTVAVPAGVAAGDYVVLAAGYDSNGANFGTPAGFTAFAGLGDISQSGPDGNRFAFLWKELTGADAGSYAFPAMGAGSDWTVIAAAFRGRKTVANGGTPQVNTLGQDTGTITSPRSAVAGGGLNVSLGDDVLWVCLPDITVSASFTGGTVPAGFTEIEDGNLGFAAGFAGVRENVAAASLTVGDLTGSFTFSSGNSGFVVLAVRLPIIDATPLPWVDQRERLGPIARQQRYGR